MLERESAPRRGVPPAILARGLTRDFGDVRAVDALDLDVPRGCIFGFLGRNGAGKTTTLRLLLGLLRPHAGEARVLGFDPVTEAHEIRRRCGVLLEHSGLLERLTARQNLELHGRIARMPRALRRARTEELLSRIGLWEKRDEPVRGWSRGMRKRLAIARALIHHPSLIFLDEPTAGLDPVSAAEVRQDLLRLADRERVTVFLTTHNLAEAERLCDRVAVVRRGRVLSTGAPPEIGALHTRRQLRIRGTGITDNVLALLADRGDVFDVESEQRGALLSLSENASTADVVRFLVRVGVGVEEVTPVGRSLEDGVLAMFSEAPDPVRRKAV